MLVLLAASQDPQTKHLIDIEEVKDLLKKTLAFLRINAQKSSSLNIDWKILHRAGVRVGFIAPPTPKRTATLNSSFTSISSGDVTMTDP